MNDIDNSQIGEMVSLTMAAFPNVNLYFGSKQIYALMRIARKHGFAAADLGGFRVNRRTVFGFWRDGSNYCGVTRIRGRAIWSGTPRYCVIARTTGEKAGVWKFRYNDDSNFSITRFRKGQRLPFGLSFMDQFCSVITSVFTEPLSASTPNLRSGTR